MIDLTNAFEEGTTAADYMPFSDWKAFGIIGIWTIPTILLVLAVVL
jgi:hypothetical protein